MQISTGGFMKQENRYVIGDIHGCYDEFRMLINRIESEDPNAAFVLVGDIIDRGPDSMKMLWWAMENCNRTDEKYVLLLGNHEYMKISFLKRYLELRENGHIRGLHDMPMDTYCFKQVLQEHAVDDDTIRQILKFFLSLPVVYETDGILDGKKHHYIVVHGDIPWYCLNKNETFSKRSLSKVYLPTAENGYGRSVVEEIVWGRNEIGHPELKHTTIIHGHSPTIFLTKEEELQFRGRIRIRPQDINVDCGMVFKKSGDKYANLAALRLEDRKEFYFYI